MTEAAITNLATAIQARRGTDERDATWLLAFAQRLTEADPPLGLDHEIGELRQRAERLRTSIDQVSTLADELLPETLAMNLDKVAAAADPLMCQGPVHVWEDRGAQLAVGEVCCCGKTHVAARAQPR